MGAVISINLQKGGVSKTTTCIATGYLLSVEYKKKVLIIDMDSQASATRILTRQSPYDFRGETVLEAMQEHEPIKYIRPIHDRLHLLPSNTFLSMLPSWLYTTNARRGRKPYEALKRIVDEMKEYYDVILIDTPPSLGDLTLNALFTSDYAIIPCETSMLAFQELDAQMELIEEVKKHGNDNLELLGILVNVIDVRRTKDNKEFFVGLNTYYPNLQFKTVIIRNADTSRVANEDIFENKKLIRRFRKDYKPFVKELLMNVRI